MMLRAENLSKRYFRKSGQANHFMAVHGATLELLPGSLTLLSGRSGSGKTTLLHMLCGLLTPSEGRVTLDGRDIYALGDGALSRLRNASFAVIPQGRSLIDSLTVYENILFPARVYGNAVNEDAARRWMEELGIEALADVRPAELSGGELRRAAIVRALTQDAPFIFADEPTGDLDDENTCRVLETLRRAAREENKSVLLVSHDAESSRYADALYRMDGGRLGDDK